MRIESRQQLIECRKEFKKALDCQYKQVVICGGSGCVAGGSLKVYDRMKQLMEERGLRVDVVLQHESHDESVGLKHSGCHGFCQMGPLMRIEPMGLLYIKVTVDDCEEIVEKTILNDEVIDRLVYHEDGESYVRQEDIPFYKQQTRVALEHCGHINAESVEEYIAVGGYTALEKALFDMTPEEIIAEVSESGLRGRGGAGFPTGKKWAQVAAHKDAPVKYIVCNGDEGDPGAFMDRSIMEGDPHRMIEGMIIAGIATGSEEGYIYVRAEYPLAVERLKMAIADDEAHGILGENIFGSGKNFRLHINRGAGAFVCGEGSALTASIEGERGMPRTKPPRSVDQGLFDAPTSLNNVETFANVPPIIERGAAWYRGIGTETSTGTKAFALTGNIKHTGLIEVPMGTTLREIVFNIGGGVSDIAVLSMGGVVVADSIPVGGDKFDEAIVDYLRKKHNLLIGARTAEELKINIGSARMRGAKLEMDACGRSLVSGLPRAVTVNSEELIEALDEPLRELISALHRIIERTPPELASDIFDEGITLSGGGAQLFGLPEVISDQLRIRTTLADEPDLCVAHGLSALIDDPDQYENIDLISGSRSDTIEPN